MGEIKFRQEFTNLQIGERRDVLSFNWGDDDNDISIKMLIMKKQAQRQQNTQHTYSRDTYKKPISSDWMTVWF